MSQDGPLREDREPEGRLVPVGVARAPAREPYGQLRYASEEQAGGGIDLLEYWRVLNKRKWLIISIVGAFVILGTLRTLMMTPLYTSTVRLQIERNVAKVVEGGNVAREESTAAWDPEFLKTQYELLQ